jgi:hypothetical protein
VNRLRRPATAADDEAMDETRSWRGWIGAALSFSALGYAIAALVSPHGRACPTPDGSSSLDLTGLLLFTIATVAIVLDVRALRRGDRFWARIGLATVSLAAILGIWGAAAGFFRPGCG